MIYIKIIFYAVLAYVLRGVLLSMIAKVLGLFLEPLNLLSAMIIHIRSRGFLNVIHQYQFQSALETDIYLHYNFRALWRITMSNGKGYKFGSDKTETLSSAIGCKFIEKTLSWHGYFWYYFLYVVDFSAWRKGGHCKYAYFSFKNKK